MGIIGIASSAPLAISRNDRGIDSRFCGNDKLTVSDPSVLKLLDVVATIIADEYIRVAKQNKEVFTDPSTSCPPGTSFGMTGLRR